MDTIVASQKKFDPWQAWPIFLIASLFFLYEFVIQISPNVMSNELMQSFDMDAVGLGFISGAYYITYTFMQIPVGLLYDRFGARKLLALACFLCALGALLFGITENMVNAAVGRMLMGAGSAFAFTGCLFLVHRWFPPRYFALMAGILMIMSAAGSILGETPLAAAVANYGWRDTLTAIAIIGFLLTVVVYLMIKDKPATSMQDTSETLPRPGEMQRLMEVVKNKQNWIIATYAFTSWAPVLIIPAFIGVLFIETACGVSRTSATNAISIAWIGIGIGSPVLGWLSDLTQRRNKLLVWSSVLGLLASCIILYFPHIRYEWICFWLFIFGVAAGAQSLTFAVVKDNNPQHQVGTAMGFNNVLVVCGGIIFQPLVGYLLRIFWDGALQDNIPIYKTVDFQYALTVVPICFAIGLWLAVFGIRETFCLSYEARKQQNLQ